MPRSHFSTISPKTISHKSGTSSIFKFNMDETFLEMYSHWKLACKYRDEKKIASAKDAFVEAGKYLDSLTSQKSEFEDTSEFKEIANDILYNRAIIRLSGNYKSCQQAAEDYKDLIKISPDLLESDKVIDLRNILLLGDLITYEEIPEVSITPP